MWLDENNDWGFLQWDAPAAVPYSSGNVQTNDLVSTTSAPTAGQDSWSGYFQSLGTSVVNFVMAKEAAQSGMVQARAANGQPVYAPAGTPVYQPATGLSGNALIIGAAIVGLVLIARKG